MTVEIVRILASSSHTVRSAASSCVS